MTPLRWRTPRAHTQAFPPLPFCTCTTLGVPPGGTDAHTTFATIAVGHGLTLPHAPADAGSVSPRWGGGGTRPPPPATFSHCALPTRAAFPPRLSRLHEPRHTRTAPDRQLLPLPDIHPPGHAPLPAGLLCALGHNLPSPPHRACTWMGGHPSQGHGQRHELQAGATRRQRLPRQRRQTPASLQ